MPAIWLPVGVTRCSITSMVTIPGRISDRVLGVHNAGLGRYNRRCRPGDEVLCDLCNADYTDSPDCGGYILSGHAVCPACALRVSMKTREYGEAPPEAVCP